MANKPRWTLPVLLRKSHEWLGLAGTVTLGLIALSCPFIAHGGGAQVGDALKKIHYGEFLPAQHKWIWIDAQGLILGLLVITGWMMHRRAVKRAAEAAAAKAKAEVLAQVKAEQAAAKAKAVPKPEPAVASV
jgi:TRAP-type C4-dicarboxylate transport system permease small subunit